MASIGAAPARSTATSADRRCGVAAALARFGPCRVTETPLRLSVVDEAAPAADTSGRSFRRQPSARRNRDRVSEYRAALAVTPHRREAARRPEVRGTDEADLAGGCGKQAVMTDAVKAARQHVQQEAADELVGGQRHDARLPPAVAPVVLVAEGDAGFVEGEQPAVGDGDAVGVARQVGKHLGRGAPTRTLVGSCWSIRWAALVTNFRTV